MKPSIKELKKKAFGIDPRFLKRYKTEIAPLFKFIQNSQKEILSLLQKAFDDNLFPKVAMEYYRTILSKDESLNKQKRLVRLSPWINEISDPEIIKKYWKIQQWIEAAEKTLFEMLSRLEVDCRFVLYDKRARRFVYEAFEAVEYILLDQPKDIWPPKEKLLNTCLVDNFNEKLQRLIINNGLIYLQIDLTYDKNEILNKCDAAIVQAKKITGNTKRARDAIMDRLFDSLFRIHYLPGKTKEAALEKIEEEFGLIGIEIDADSLNKRYIPRLKKRYGVKDIRELKGGR